MKRLINFFGILSLGTLTMERYFFTFFTGALLSLFLPIVPDFFYVILFTVIAIVIFFWRKLRYFSTFFLAMAWVFFHAVSYQTSWQENNIELSSFFSHEHQVQGQISSLINFPEQVADNSRSHQFSQYQLKSSTITPSESRFNFWVTELDGVTIKQPFLIRVNWLKPTKHLLQNQHWQLSVKLKPAHGFANPGGFSYQTWLRKNDIVATGYVTNKPAQLLVVQSSWRQTWFNQFNDRVLQTHQQFPHNSEDKIAQRSVTVALLQALTFGVRDNISQDNWQILQATGTQHLIAISGLHVGLVASASFYLLFFFVKKLPLRILPQGMKNMLLSGNSVYFCSVLSCGIAIYYSYLAGFSAPTVRALIMLLSFWALKYSGIYFTKTRWVLCTLTVIILLEPMSLISLSFWLSFYAVIIIFLILWFYQKQVTSHKPWLNYLQLLLLIQLGLTCFILPIAAYLQYQISLITFFANLLAVPWLSFVVLPLSLLSVLSAVLSNLLSPFLALPFTPYLIYLSEQSTLLLWQWLTFWAAQDWALFNVNQHTLLILSCILVFFLCLLVVQQHQKNFIFFSKLSRQRFFMNCRRASYLLTNKMFAAVFITAILASLIVLVSNYLNISREDKALWQAYILDVGQGLAVVVKKDQKVLLYDTGASYPSGFNLAETVIVPFLKSQGIFTIDRLYISHSDNDHAGGLPWLRKHFVINKVISNDQNLQPDHYCQGGTQDNWLGLNIEILWPTVTNKQGLQQENLQEKIQIENAHGKQKNDQSCVLLIGNDNGRLLLTGDISIKTEGQLLRNSIPHKNSLKADVLVAPHHGSNTSSSLAFLQAVNPTYAVFSTGFLNRWKMPRTKVLNRYQQLAINTYNTAESGAVLVNYSPEEVQVLQYRQDLFPFWFAN